MTNNRKFIITRAWGNHREKLQYFTYINAAGRRGIFRDVLRQAWSEAKGPAPELICLERQRIRDAIGMLDNKSRWTRDDHAHSKAVYAELQVAA